MERGAGRGGSEREPGDRSFVKIYSGTRGSFIQYNEICGRTRGAWRAAILNMGERLEHLIENAGCFKVEWLVEFGEEESFLFLKLWQVGELEL